MLRKLRQQSHSLIFRLMCCLTILTLVMVLICFYVYHTTYGATLEAAYQDFYALSVSMGGQLEQSLDALNSAARLAGYNMSAQEFLMSAAPAVTISSFRSASSFLSLSFHPDFPCLNVFIQAANGRHLYQNNLYIDAYRAMLADQGLTDTVQVNNPYFVKANGFGTLSDTCFFYIYPVYWYHTTSIENQILCTVLFDAKSFVDHLPNASAMGTVCVLFQNMLIYSSADLTGDEADYVLSSAIGEEQSAIIQQADYLFTKTEQSSTGWQFAYLLPTKSIRMVAADSMRMGILFSGAALLGILSIMLVMFIPLNREVRGLVSDIEKLHLLRPGATPPLCRANLTELKLVANALNDMMLRLEASHAATQEQQQRAFDAQLAQKNAELIGYRSQITPHFIFNSLESLRSLAVINRDRTMASMISAMAGMFRYALHAPLVVPLSSEISNVNDYLTVMNTRFPGRYHLLCRLQPSLKNQQMLSMVLQPLTENCIRHAFPPKQSVCRIVIRALSRDGMASISITDNGRGVAQETLEQMERDMLSNEITAQTDSIGLKNIYHRMQLTFGDTFRIRFRSRLGCYTQVILEVPAATVGDQGNQEEQHVQSDVG